MAVCRSCGTASDRVHGRYSRELSDVPIAGVATKILLRVRRFICGNAACTVRTFAEQVDGVTHRRVRSTDGLRRTLTAIGLALAGRAGSRLAAVLGMVTSRSSLLRLVRALPDPPERPVAVLGVDDFAIKKGQNYGTVLIDCEDGRVVDLLPGRDAAPLAGWLHSHSKPQVVCRDRASAYAEGARTGAPDAVQVADRFHLWQNLAKAVERCVARYKNCLQESVVAPVNGQPDADAVPEPSGAMAQRRREHHKLVHDLLGQGAGIRKREPRLRRTRTCRRSCVPAATSSDAEWSHRRIRPPSGIADKSAWVRPGNGTPTPGRHLG